MYTYTYKKNQSRIIEQAQFTYSPLSKAFEKQVKGRKQVEALKALIPEENQELESIEGLFPKKMRNMKLKLRKIKLKKWEDKVK